MSAPVPLSEAQVSDVAKAVFVTIAPSNTALALVRNILDAAAEVAGQRPEGGGLRAAVEKELRYAEDHARHVINDEVLVEVGLIRFALNHPALAAPEARP